MIVRGTNKILKISGIKPQTFAYDSSDVFPGDWYANTIKTGRPGKIITLFFHNHTKISIICPTKSLNIAIGQLPDRLKSYLIRHGFESLIERFELDSEVNVYKTSSRRTLGFMNQISANIEWHLINADSLIEYNYDKLEDIHSYFLFSIYGSTSKYETTIGILKTYKQDI